MADIRNTGAMDFRQLQDENMENFQQGLPVEYIQEEDLREVNPEEYSKQQLEYLTRRFVNKTPREAAEESLLKSQQLEQALEGSDYGSSRYDLPLYDLNALNNLENIRGLNQSGFNQIMSGLGKMGVLTATTFADNFIGSLVGLGNIIYEATEGNINSGKDVLNAFVDNPFSNLMQDLNDRAEEIMPNYYTDEEKNSPWYTQFWRANFIGDKFLKNVGFFAGAAASGYVSSLGWSKLLGLGKARDIFRGAAIAAEAPDGITANAILKAAKSGDVTFSTKQISDALLESAKTLKNKSTAVKLLSGVSGSIGESRIEAITNSRDKYEKLEQITNQSAQQAIDNIPQQLYAEYGDSLFDMAAIYDSEGKQIGVQPQVKRGKEGKVSELYNERLAKIQEAYKNRMGEIAKEKIDYSNTSFLLNMLITSADNIAVFGDAFAGGYSMKRAYKDLVKPVAKGAEKDVFYEANKAIARQTLAKGIMSPIAEGTQEMLQQTVTEGLNRWEGGKYNSFYGEGVDEDGLKAQTDWLGTMMSALGDVYSDADQWENFFLGFITGALPVPTRARTVDRKTGEEKSKISFGGELWESIREYKEIKQKSDELAGKLNGVYKALNDAAEDKERMAFLADKVRTSKLDAASDAAVEEGNSFAYKNIEFDKLMSHAIAFAEAGRADDFINLVEAYYTVRPEDLEQIKQTGVIKGSNKSIFDGKSDEQLLEYFNKQKDDAVAIAKQFQEVYTNLNSLYGNDIAGYTEEMTHKVMSIDNREKRIKEISDKLINYVKENVESIAATNPDFAQRIAEGNSPLEALQSIKDLAIAFDKDDINELQKLIYQKEASLEKLANRIKLKSARRWGSAGANQKRVTTLERKQETEGLTKEESKELAKRKKIIENKKNDAETIFAGLVEVKKALDKSREVDLQKQTMDLASLLIDRESLLNDFALLSNNKEAFKESLARQVMKSLSDDSKRKLDAAYADFAKNKDISRVSRQNVFATDSQGNILYGSISAKDMADMAKQAGNKRLEDYATKLAEYQNYFNEEEEDGAVFNRNASRKSNEFAKDIERTIRKAYGKDYGVAIDNFLDSDDAEVKYGKDFIDAFRKYRADISSAQAATKGKATRKTTDEAPIEESDRLKKLKKYSNDANAVQKMSRNELDKLVEELDIVGEVVSIADDFTDDADIKELSDIPESSYADYVLMAIEDAIQNGDTESTETKTEKSKTTEEKNQDASGRNENDEEDEDDSPVDEPEEEEPEEDTEEINIANRRNKVTPTRRNIRPRVSDTPSSDDMTGETKIGQAKNSVGNSERPLLPKEATISKETFAVNRVHAKYQYTELKDPTKRIAIPYDDDVRSTLDWYKVQEFIDSGDLAKLKEKAEKEGHPLRAHFVVLYNQVDRGFNSFRAAKQPIFMAVEASKKDAPNGNLVEFYDAAGRKKQMQVIGMVSEPNEKTNPEEYTQYKLLQEEVYARHEASYSKEGKRTHNRRFNTGIVTNLSWIYPGRAAKAVDDGTGELNKQPNDQIDVNDLLTTEQLNNPDGHLQISIVTRHKNYDFGNKLGGEEIPLNENRPASGYPGSPISRTATIWIKTKEADGRVYYKGARIKDFNTEYEYDDSPIAKKIKEAIKHIVEAGTDVSKIHKGYDELLKYIYLSGKKPIFVNTKKGTVSVKGSSVQDMPIEFDNEEQLNSIVDAIYNGIKESGVARFSLGLDGTLSLKDILDSRIVTTDLGSLHNVNASLLVDKVEVGEGDAGNRQVVAVPSTTIEEWRKTRLIHTGVEGIVDERSYTVPVSLDGGATSYRKRASDHRWYDESTNEPIEDDFLSWKLDFYLDIKLGSLEPSKLYFGNKKNRIYIREYNGQEVWMDSTGHVLTPKEITDLGNNMSGHSAKDSSKRKKSSDKNATSDEEKVIQEGIKGVGEGLKEAFEKAKNDPKAIAERDERVSSWLNEDNVEAAFRSYSKGAKTVEEVCKKAIADNPELPNYMKNAINLIPSLPKANATIEKFIEEENETPINNTAEDTPSVIEDEFGKPRNKRKVTPTNTGEMSEAQKEGWNAIVQIKNFFSSALREFYGKSFMKTLTRDNVNKDGLENAVELLKDYVDLIDDNPEMLKAKVKDIDAIFKENNECGGWKIMFPF